MFGWDRMEAGFSRAVAEELYSKCDQDRDGSLTAWRFDDVWWFWILSRLCSEICSVSCVVFLISDTEWYLGEVTNQDIGWLVSDNLATLDQVTPSSTVELCEVFMGSGTSEVAWSGMNSIELTHVSCKWIYFDQSHSEIIMGIFH